MEKIITTLLFLITTESGAQSSLWSVTFENQDLCALKGSSVELRCSYKYPSGQTVRSIVWYKGVLQNGNWTRVELSALPSYDNRLEYDGDLQHNSSLVIRDLQDSDYGFYYFRFDTESYGWRSRKSVLLSITELRVRVSPERVRAGDNVSLQCESSCQLPNIVWFRDGHPVASPEFQAQADDSGNYSCAIKGKESEQPDPVAVYVWYPPLNVSIEVSYPGELAESSGVNLTCSSAANPAADNYTWYRGSVSDPDTVVQVGSEQVLSLVSIEHYNIGPYICQARNSFGGNNSTKMLLRVNHTNAVTTSQLIMYVGIGIKIVIVLLLSLVIIWVCRKKLKSTADNDEKSHDYENVCTA